MNIWKRLFCGGRNQVIVHGSTKLGLFIFLSMVIFCVIGSIMLPMDVFQSETQLKDLPPSSSYLKVDSSLNPEDVKTIASTISYSMALTKEHKIVMWGDVSSPPNDLLNQEIVQIAAGNHHALALDAHGKLHGWGSMEHGASTLPKEYENITIRNIYAGEDCSAILSEDGFLYLWGNIGVFNTIDEAYQGHIKDMSFGVHHLALLLDDGKVVILGNQGSEIAEMPPVLQEGTVIESIALSIDHAIALDDQGNAYIWGANINIPVIEEPIIMVDASAQVVFALGESGTLYSFGEAQYGELNYDKEQRYQAIYADSYQIYGVNDELHSWGNSGFPLGSDAHGRDILTRLAHGGLITMGIGLIACVIETLLGIVIGLWAGYRGGWIDHLLMRIADIVSSIPFMPLLITLSAFLGKEWGNTARMWLIMILLGLLAWPNLARLLRSAILAEREKEYVISAKIMGARTGRILLKTLLPQVKYLILVNAALSYADAMLIESSLSFLGFGVQAPYPTWGNMLDGAQTTYVLESCWWQWILPALSIMLVIFSVNMIGEGLRKKANPRSKR